MIHDILRLRLANPIPSFSGVCDVREEISSSAELQKYMTVDLMRLFSARQALPGDPHKLLVLFSIVDLIDVGLSDSKLRRTSIAWRGTNVS